MDEWETIAVKSMERQRWGDEPTCPHCDGSDVYQMQARDGGRERGYRWRCRGCNRQYSVRIGTFMEDSKIPMKAWSLIFWLACYEEEGVSARTIVTETGISYKSALFAMRRIRWAVGDPAGLRRAA